MQILYQCIFDLYQVIVLYVDDILITGRILDIGSIKSSLHNVFSMTNLGFLKHFLVLEIEKYDVGTNVSQ